MSDSISAEQLRNHIEAIERLSEERAGIQDDIKDRYALLKSEGFDVKTVRKIVARRKVEAHHAQESDMLFATYAAALGMQLSFDI